MTETTRQLPALWPNDLEIKIIGLAGKPDSGKTLWALSVDPRNTLMFDFETSGATYHRSMGVKRIDVPGMMLTKHEGRPYLPIDLFRYFYGAIKSVTPGKFSVIVLDTVSPLEIGLAEHVKASYRDYGFSTQAKFENTGGIFWGNANNFYEQLLLYAATKCQTLVFTTHLRGVWKHGKPTTAKEPKGKSVLDDLATIRILLDRPPNTKAPIGQITKGRLAQITLAEDGSVENILPVLPPQMDPCTPAALKAYIESPPNYKKLKAREKVIEKPMTDEEKLHLEAETADNNRVAQESMLQRVERQAELRAMQLAEAEVKPQSPDQTAKVNKAAAAKRGEEIAKVVAEDAATVATAVAATEEPALTNRPITQGTLELLHNLAIKVNKTNPALDVAAIMKRLCDRYGVGQETLLTEVQGRESCGRLQVWLDKPTPF